MENITLESRDGVLIASLGRGKANAMNPAMLAELRAAVRQAEEDASVRALVFASSRPRFFSSGFDVLEVFSYDRPQMHDFFGDFLELCEASARLPKPVVGAVSGHAFAGGAVLALACDARIFAAGPFGFALNEVNLGIMLPPGVMRMAIAAAGHEAARRLLLEGQTFSPEQSLACGLAAAVVDPEQTLGKALEHALMLGAKPAGAYALVKSSLLHFAGHHGTDREHLPAFLDQWFSEECRASRTALADSLRK